MSAINRSKIKFKQVYLDVINENPEVITLNENELDLLDKQNKKDKLLTDTNTHLFVTIVASIFVFLAPYLYIKLYTTLSDVTLYMISTRKILSPESIQILTLSFSFGFLALVMYFLLPIFKKEYSVLNFKGINIKQSNYKIAIFISQYIALGFLILTLFLNFDITVNFIAKSFTYYLFLPLAIISTISLMFLLLFILMPIDRFNQKKAKQKINLRVKICYNLLIVLKKISTFDNLYFLNHDDSKELINNLGNINNLIKNYDYQFENHLHNHNIHHEFERIADEFEKNLIIYITTKDAHTEIIKKSLTDYLNIFLKGDLSKLPKSENLPIEEKVKKAKLLHFILLGIYISLPIIIILALKLIFGIKLDEFTQSILRILYLIWAFIGVFSNPFILNNESKDLLKDILKTITGKN